jgi:hypothetical protein
MINAQHRARSFQRQAYDTRQESFAPTELGWREASGFDLAIANAFVSRSSRKSGSAWSRPTDDHDDFIAATLALRDLAMA